MGRDQSDCGALELTDCQVSSFVFSWFLENREKRRPRKKLFQGSCPITVIIELLLPDVTRWVIGRNGFYYLLLQHAWPHQLIQHRALLLVPALLLRRYCDQLDFTWTYWFTDFLEVVSIIEKFIPVAFFVRVWATYINIFSICWTWKGWENFKAMLQDSR